MMAITTLNDQELAIVGQCLRAAAEGPFFPDWEFQTLMGVSREELTRLALRWPSVATEREITTDIVVSVLNNLLGYPHGKESAWGDFIKVEPAVVSAILDAILVPQRRA
jgi:hypothetical protein